MTIFVLSEGERYEGGRVIGVYGSLESGLRAAERSREQGGLMAWAGKWTENVSEGCVYWTRAVDWLELRRWEVES